MFTFCWLHDKVISKLGRRLSSLSSFPRQSDGKMISGTSQRPPQPSERVKRKHPLNLLRSMPSNRSTIRLQVISSTNVTDHNGVRPIRNGGRTRESPAEQITDRCSKITDSKLGQSTRFSRFRWRSSAITRKIKVTGP